MLFAVIQFDNLAFVEIKSDRPFLDQRVGVAEPGLVGDKPIGNKRFLAADGNAPQAWVIGISRCFLGNGNATFAQVIRRELAADTEFAHRRLAFDLAAAQNLRRNIKAVLVIACACRAGRQRCRP